MSGLLGSALAAGISGMAGAIADTAKTYETNRIDAEKRSMLMQLEETLARRVVEYKEQVLRGHETWKMDQADQRRRQTAGEIESEAELLATKRINKPVQDQADQAALAYSNSDLPQADKELAYRAAEEYASKNSSDTAPISSDDRIQAAIKLGHINPKDTAALSSKESEREMKALIAQGRIDSALQIAGAKGDIAMQVAGVRADAQRDVADSRGGPTNAQKAKNVEIDLARQTIEGMTQEEIKRRTQQFTNTGRENSEYDSQLAGRMKRAYQRKVGDDQWFDDLLASGTDIKAMTEETLPRSNDAILMKFKADKNMRGKGFKLGKRTPKGIEVLDSSGKLVGHYN